MQCPECNGENVPTAQFCKDCGAKLEREEEPPSKTSRTIELALGISGGVFGLIGGIFALLFSFFVSDALSLGISAVLASIVGIVGAIYVTKNPRWGGIILIISAIWLLISISLFGLLGAILLLIAGIVALVRK